MTDLRKAAQAVVDRWDTPSWKDVPATAIYIEALRQALAQHVDAVNMSQDCVDETAKREHEPVGYIDGMYGGYMVFTPLNPSAVYLNGTALYTAPPKREWVGLTDEDLSVCDEDGVLLARYWEAKLKEKNG